MNGPVKVTFAQNPKGPVSFKSVNGTLDVAFRPGLNADVRMKTLNGGFYTDFPVMALPVDGGQPEHRIWRGNRLTGVRIGGGGGYAPRAGYAAGSRYGSVQRCIEAALAGGESV